MHFLQPQRLIIPPLYSRRRGVERSVNCVCLSARALKRQTAVTIDSKLGRAITYKSMAGPRRALILKPKDHFFSSTSALAQALWQMSTRYKVLQRRLTCAVCKLSTLALWRYQVTGAMQLQCRHGIIRLPTILVQWLLRYTWRSRWTKLNI